MNFLIDLFNKAFKGDSYRISNSPYKYSDLIPTLNAPQTNKTNKSSSSIPVKIQKTKSSLNQSTSKGSKLPGS